MKVDSEIIKKCHILRYELNKKLGDLCAYIVDERTSVVYESLVKSIESVIDALDRLIEEEEK